MGNYNSQQRFRRYPNKLGKYADVYKRQEFDIMFGEGISRAGEIIDLGAELGIIKKSGSWFSYNETKIAQGLSLIHI